MKCSKCGFESFEGAKFCNECGHAFAEGEPLNEAPAIKRTGERKHVTILFSDLSGYTAMAEKLDPEDVREITGRIFGEAAGIIGKYEGVVEKYIGDAVMAVFGIPKAHEDDPVRAIKAAREIHRVVHACGNDLKSRIGCELSMHSGIHTGLVVTGEMDLEKGIHGVAGDTINVASRLSGVAGEDRILVGHLTFRQAEGHFHFEPLQPVAVKGRAEPVRVYELLSAREKPVTLHRLTGLRAGLTGRNAEMAQLQDGLKYLRQGKGAVFSICGDAGTGKSRLVEEFKNTLDLKEVQWLEGHAYAYSQNTSYSIIVDLLNQVFAIEEGDSLREVEGKVSSGLASLVDNHQDILPYIGSLYSLPSSELEEINPEIWKSRLQDSWKTVVSALARRKKTVFFLEDLHWADRSSIELLQTTLAETRDPAVVLCVHRPAFSLFTEAQQKGLGEMCREIGLQDLSPSEAQDMLESLLKTKDVPSALQQYVKDKTEGNPFYLEEMINSLIEAGILVQDNGAWRLTRQIIESDIPSTLQGLISSRLDRLEMETKRVLQEASVIGRAFLYDILRRITELKEKCEGCLSVLEDIDIVKRKSLHPDLEYMFKHGLTQEVAYNGLLRKDREKIHEKIAFVMEEVFGDRLPEFYETLAFHYARSQSDMKAAEYLRKAGEKSLERYAVEEADQYFRGAFDLLSKKIQRSRSEDIALVDILNKWGYCFYYLGEVRSFIDLFDGQRDLAESVGDDARFGMFNAWYGIAYYLGGRPKVAYDHLQKSMKLAQRSGSEKVEGYAHTWLTWTCIELGLYEEAKVHGETAQRIAASHYSDQYLYFKSLGGLTLLHTLRGELQEGYAGARLLLKYGKESANSRSNVLGHWIMAMGYLSDHELEPGRKEALQSIASGSDPLYQQFGWMMLGYRALLTAEFKEAEEAYQAVVDFCRKTGDEQALVNASIFLGSILVARGRMAEGMSILDEAHRVVLERGRKTSEALYEYSMGMLYAQIATGSRPGFFVIVKNIGCIVRKVPFAARRAEAHFKKAIETSRRLGANYILGQCCFELSLLYKSRKKGAQARELLKECVCIFEKGGFKNMLIKAKDALSSCE